MGPLQPQPPPDDAAPALRASDADREAAAEVLRTAAGDGRIDLSELNERLDLVYAARTKAQLSPLLADLGEPTGSVLGTADTQPLVLDTKSGTVKRVGHWLVPRQIMARSTSGTVKLDFTEGDCPHREVIVQAETRSGSVVLVVPRGWNVRILSSSTGSGNVLNKANDPPRAGAPTLSVHASVRSGTVKVRYPYRSRRR